jgi:large subunit ribosomal protein L24e
MERVCAFSGQTIEAGTGLMYVKKNGEVLHYVSRKCLREHQGLKRAPRYTLWTKASRVARGKEE